MTEQNNQPIPSSAVGIDNMAPRYEVIKTEQFRPKYAGFWIRFWAYVVDLIIVSSISGIVVKPIFRVVGLEITKPDFLLFSPYKIVLLILLLVYFALMTKLFGQTVGKIILGIRVVQKDEKPLTWGTVLFREVVGRFISKTLLIPYLLAIFMPKKEALHDLFADTYVIHEHSYEKETIMTRRKVDEGEQLQDAPHV
ncbi:putative RDD family membrane protein YckC [Sporosarcina luteola]|nr:putative RDD family membrane protein YckC [Sporosarcina luteola]